MDYIDQPTSVSPRDVWARVSFIKLLNVDTQNQKFEAVALLEAKWHDPQVDSLAFDVAKLQWKPELYIENSISESRNDTDLKIFRDVDGRLMASQINKVKGTFSENLELENFPLDIQNSSYYFITLIF